MNAQQTIDQLGGNRFRMLTGAKNFTKDGETLTFKIPQANQITHVRITLTPADLYRVEFLRVTKRCPLRILSAHDDIYADRLAELFTEQTGLYTSL